MPEKKKLTALTDPDNLMVVWDAQAAEEEAQKRPAKKAAKKAAPKGNTRR